MNKKEIIEILEEENPSILESFYNKTQVLRQNTIGSNIYLRGLVELSNICQKDCYYCGIRNSNSKVNRYYIPKEEVVSLIKLIYKNNWGSAVIQTGEMQNKEFINDIAYILKESKKQTSDNFRITLSCGEQTEDTYKLWKDSGADRYLLRFETSSSHLYSKYHPQNLQHDFKERIKDIKVLQKLGYQTGTGILIGTPYHTNEQLADDLLFIKELNIDMLGMGPYIEHVDTPMYKKNIGKFLSIKNKVDLSFKSLAILRNLMPYINSASTTALETLDENAFKKALLVSANVFMPNITPSKYKENYRLYENKKSIDLNYLKQDKILFKNIAFGQSGDSKHFIQRQNLLKNIMEKI